MFTRSSLLLCVLILNAVPAFSQTSRLFDWTIDENLSSLTLSGTLYGPDGSFLGNLVEQAPGSLSAQLGQYMRIPVALSTQEGAILGLADTDVSLSHLRPFKTAPTGTPYRGNIDFGTQGSIAVDLSSFFGSVGVQSMPLAPTGNGTYSFDSSAFMTTWYGDLNYESFGPLFTALVGSGSERVFSPDWGTEQFSNQAAPGTLAINDGTMTLSVPVNQTHEMSASFVSPLRVEITVSGQIVASAPAYLLEGSFPNGSFENLPPTPYRDLNPWDTSAEAISYGAYAPTDGSKSLVHRTEVIDDVFSNGLISQSDRTSVAFIAEPGDVLTFDYYIDVDSTADVFVDLRTYLFQGSGSSIVRASGDSATVDTSGWRSAEIRFENGGTYFFEVETSIVPWYDGDSFELGLDNFRLTPLGAFENPVLPTTVVTIPGSEVPVFVFEDIPTGQWVDPPTASGFLYTMTSDSLFTAILDFPTGFDNPFTVSVGDQILGVFSPGELVDFESLLGAGVTSFMISGISPLVDPEDPFGFPLKLAFNTPTASFTMMQAVPEVGALPLCLTVVGLSVGYRRLARTGKVSQ